MLRRYLLAGAVIGLLGCSGASVPGYRHLETAGDPRCMERTGTSGSDRQVGTSCDDHFYAGSGDDTQQGGAGRDTLFGGTGQDIQLGDEGDDVLFGGEGSDWQSGGPGDDTLIPGSGHGYVDGGPGNDTLIIDAGYWSWDAAVGGWRNRDTGAAIRVEAMERVLDTDGRQIWP